MKILASKKLMMTCSSIGAIGGIITHLLGGFDKGLILLIALMVADYITGVIVAGVFRKSYHSKAGGLSSKAGKEGLSKKVTVLIFVIIGALMDDYFGIDVVRNSIIIGFSANELISVVENAGLMGLPLPTAITNAIEILKHNAETKEVAK